MAMSVVKYIPFRGKMYDFSDKELSDLLEFKGEGETLEQTLERVYIEAEEDIRLGLVKPNYNTPTQNPNTLDYYLLKR